MTGKPRTPRYILISIPGRRDDGRDTWWSVFDRRRHRAVPDAVLPGDRGRVKLVILARAMNAPKRRNRQPPKTRTALPTKKRKRA